MVCATTLATDRLVSDSPYPDPFGGGLPKAAEPTLSVQVEFRKCFQGPGGASLTIN